MLLLDNIISIFVVRRRVVHFLFEVQRKSFLVRKVQSVQG